MRAMSPKVIGGIVIVAATAAIFSALYWFNPGQSTDQGLPNVVYIMTDDLGIGDLALYNPNSPILTPRLDELAAGGMTLTNFRAAAPVCTSTRAAVLTGLDPARLGLRTIVGRYSTAGLGSEVETLAEVFNGAGYDTVHIGKWHLGNGSEYSPITAGFQKAIRTSRYYRDVLMFTDEGLPVVNGQENQKARRQWQDLKADDVHTTQLYADQAIELINRSVKKDNPFFLNLWFHAPHVESNRATRQMPWQLPSSSPLFNNPEAPLDEIYIELVEYVDEQVGRIMDALEAAGVADNTLLIFTSDNGGLRPYPHNFLPWSNAGVRGWKNSHYDGGLRVPFIARWPGIIHAGSTSGDFAVSEDFFATVADILGTAPAANTEGKSLLNTLKGRSNAAANRRTVVFEGADLSKHVDVDVVRPYDYAVIQDGRWKLVSVGFRALEYGLYDLVTDPLEATNLIDDPAHAQRLADMSNFYEEWSRTTSRADLTTGGQSIDPAWTERFDGTRLVGVDANPVLDFGNQDFTLTMDVIAAAASLTAPGGVVLAERPGSFTMRIRPDQRVEVAFINSEDGSPVLVSASALAADRQARVSVTVKGWVQGSLEERTTMGRLYIDGVREDLQPLASAKGHIERSGKPLILGGVEAGAEYVGVIRTLEVHNRTLTGAELLALGPLR